MKKKALMALLVSISILIFTGCNTGSKDIKINNDLPKYSEITSIEHKDGKAIVYKIENEGIYKIGSMDDFAEITYNLKAAVSAYNIRINSGQNLNNTKLIINKAGREKTFNNCFNFNDIKVSPDGNYLAYRCFLSDSLESAQGVKLLNISDFKEINFKSKVLVSGNLYRWLDNKHLLYYGSMEGKTNSDSIYVYEVDSGKEQVYFDKIEGYCTYFKAYNDELLYLDKSGMYIYNKKEDKKSKFSISITQVFNTVYNKENGEIYLIGKEEFEKLPAVYKIDKTRNKITRLTYDFPRIVDFESGMCIDDKGNVYFTGEMNEGDNKKKDIFMINKENKSINLISNHSGNYLIYEKTDK